MGIRCTKKFAAILRSGDMRSTIGQMIQHTRQKNESFEEELSKGSVRLKIKHIFMRLLLFAANLYGSKRHRAADSKVSCVAAHPVIS